MEDNNIDYKPQIKFKDLTGIKGGLLSYDFGIMGNEELTCLCLIECQGQQHYYPVDRYGGEEKFEIQQMHDELKKEYAEEIGATLIEIPYTMNTFEKFEQYLMEELKNAGII